MKFGTKYTDLDECLDTYIEWYEGNQHRVTTTDDKQTFLHRAMNGRVYILHLLRNELVAYRAWRPAVTELDSALEDYTTWYAANSETILDPLKFMAFAKKATNDCLSILHLMRTELRHAQEKYAEDTIQDLPLIYR